MTRVEEIMQDVVKDYVDSDYNMENEADFNKKVEKLVERAKPFEEKFKKDGILYAIIKTLIVYRDNESLINRLLQGNKLFIKSRTRDYRWIPDELYQIKELSNNIFTVTKSQLGRESIPKNRLNSIRNKVEEIKNLYNILNLIEYKYASKEDIMVEAEQQLSESMLDLYVLEKVQNGEKVKGIKQLSMRLEQHIKSIKGEDDYFYAKWWKE